MRSFRAEGHRSRDGHRRRSGRFGARVALELATRGRTLSVIAIAPDGLGMPLERLHQAAALLTGRALAMLLAPIATPVAATGAGRSLFFAMERSRAWQLPAEDARQLLLGFAGAPGYLAASVLWGGGGGYPARAGWLFGRRSDWSGRWGHR